MREPFSLLVPVYHGDRPDSLRRSFRSAVDDQTMRPDEVIIVQDGPVGDELAQCLSELQASSPAPVTLVTLERNGGLGPALDRGLAASRYDIVARQDADDVSMPVPARRGARTWPSTISGSGKLATPWARMHCEYATSCAERSSPEGVALPPWPPLAPGLSSLTTLLGGAGEAQAAATRTMAKTVTPPAIRAAEAV